MTHLITYLSEPREFAAPEYCPLIITKRVFSQFLDHRNSLKSLAEVQFNLVKMTTPESKRPVVCVLYVLRHLAPPPLYLRFIPLLKE